MGYEVHITRKDDWSAEEGREITLEEWKSLIEQDPEMRLDDYAEAEIPGEGVLRVENEGLAVWRRWSKNGKDGGMAWFGYFGGNISVKNPDREILQKMWQISESLGAKVQGDDGEIYDSEGSSNWAELKA